MHRLTPIAACLWMACACPEGTDAQGECMDGQEPALTQPQTADTDTEPRPVATAIASGYHHACALVEEGRPLCWGATGDYDYGQVGNTPDMTGLLSIYAGGYQTCALDAEGSPTCWGSTMGIVPNGPFTELAVGRDYVCGLTPEGAAQCWGSNALGQLDVPPDIVFTTLAGGWAVACGLDTEGGVHCWGYEEHVPPAVPEGSFTHLDLFNNTACALDTDGYVLCFGEDTAQVVSFAPNDTPFADIRTGAWHACGVTDSFSPECWGSDYSGQGQLGGEGWVDIKLGGFHDCGLDTAGHVTCRGLSDFGVTKTPWNSR